MAAATKMAVLTAECRTSTITSPAPIERVRYDVCVRRLVVVCVDPLTTSMLRITFSGDDLVDFDSRGFDDHVKLLLPQPGGAVERRDYTPRRFDRDARTLAIRLRAARCRPGSVLGAASPARRSPGDRRTQGIAGRLAGVSRWLLIGDETALPVIGRLFEEAAPGVELTSLVVVTGVEAQQTFVTAGMARMQWVQRSSAAATDPTPLIGALDKVTIEPEAFVWVAAEGAVARVLRERFSQPAATVDNRAEAHRRSGGLSGREGVMRAFRDRCDPMPLKESKMPPKRPSNSPANRVLNRSVPIRTAIS